MKLFNQLILLISALCVCCGVEIGNPKDPTPVQESKLTEDTFVTSLVLNDQYSEALESVTDVYDSRSTATFLLTQSYNRTFTCNDSGDSTVVVANIAGNIEFTRGSDDLERTILETVTKSSTAIWSSPDQTIACLGENRRARIEWGNFESLTLNIEHSAERTRNVRKTSTNEVIIDKTMLSSGSRQIVYNISNTGAVTETIQSSLSRSVNFEGKRGSGSFTHSTLISDENPLVIEKVFQDNAISNITIVSGTIQSTLSDGSIVSSQFKNLNLDSNTCTPNSGIVEGATYLSASEMNANVSFVIEFSQGQGIVTFSNGQTESFSGGFCTFN